MTEAETAPEQPAPEQPASGQPSEGVSEDASPSCDWAARGAPATQLAVCTFGILALELATIRLLGGQIRVMAYFQNMVLVAAFLGMGLGVALGRRRPDLIHACLPAMAGLSLLIALAPQLGLSSLHFPDPSMFLWGADDPLVSASQFLIATGSVIGLFWVVVTVFLLAGTPVGYLFDRLPPLRAYSLDLIGSLLGVVAMAGVAALSTPPIVWLALGCLPLLWISRRAVGAAATVVVLACGVWTAQDAHYSPYNRIDVSPLTWGSEGDWNVWVNQDFHQFMVDLRTGGSGEIGPRMKEAYELPYRLHGEGRRALIMGAGSGTDVAAALRSNCAQVVAVDIDATILRLGKELHPEKPYDDPRVTQVVADARSWLERNPDERFDVVVYGLLDSHAMFSAMSSLRLDNFVYTVEGIRAGWEHLEDDGLLSLSFSMAAGPWMVARMTGLVTEATGEDPLIVFYRDQKRGTFLVQKGLSGDALLGLEHGVPFERMDNTIEVPIPTDDWPFLYLNPDVFPLVYLSVLALIVLTAFLAVGKVYGRRIFSAERFDTPLFLLGAAFMLLETRAVTALGLVFGSTWVVNASVFTGILLVVLAANLAVERWTPKRLEPWYALLTISLLVTWLIGPGVLHQFPMAVRGLLGGLMFALPVGFAGVVFSTLLKRSRNPSGSLGSNLFGAVIGGVIEYSSMALGLGAVALLALVIYMGSYLVVRRAELTS